MLILLSQIKSFETYKFGGKNVANDIKASLKSFLNPIINYANSFDVPTEEEISILIERVSHNITPKNVFLVLGKSFHYVLYEAYKSTYPYYNKYSIKTIKSLREFFDSYAGNSN